MTFSRRLGITSTKALQLHEVDDDLRNSLWNLATTFFPVTAKEPYFEDKPAVNSFYRSLWGDFFKWPTDILQRWPNANDQLRNAYFRFEWNVIYDFIEFLRTIPSDAVGLAFASACNQVLETEHSGYRFVGDVVTPITSATEVDAIEEALNVPDKLRPVAQHIDAALRLYADREAPDYRNSIKESISAVEALCKLVADTPKASLGDALRALSAKVAIHGALKQGFEKLYGYTSNEDGIRHAMMEGSDVQSEDAKFMLVSCSAFTTCVIEKCSRGGMSL